jgi:hypothetical protein
LELFFLPLLDPNPERDKKRSSSPKGRRALPEEDFPLGGPPTGERRMI